MAVGIGSTIYVYDVNLRKYDENHRLISRECWRPVKIIGETRVSWITNYFNQKFPKKNGYYLTSEKQVDEREWIRENIHRISGYLDVCKDYEKIKQIAEILEYHENENV